MERGVRDMAIDVVKLYEEVQKENKGTGVTAEVTKHVGMIKNELKKAGVKEVSVSTVRKMVEKMMMATMDEEAKAEFKLGYSTVRDVVNRKFVLKNKCLVIE
jgi:molybdopterin synthase catalytic subunit